jgi:CRISPR-associated exonuclease Cas4
VVIPINTATLLRSRDALVHRASDDTLHWVIGEVIPPDLLTALDSEDECLMRERERLLYVACTRARELLILPELPQANQKSWARIIDMKYRDLPMLDLATMSPAPRLLHTDPPNAQTPELFAAERTVIEALSVPLSWIRPSDHDPDRIPMTEAAGVEPDDAIEVEAPTGAGRLRGLLLHKLMEEVLTGELADDVAALARRAGELLAEFVLDAKEGAALPSTDELAATAWRTLQLPEIGAIRGRLVPEWPIYALLESASPRCALAGRIDAVAFDGEKPDIVVDWKSDLDPSERDMRVHAGQLEDYLRATAARQGALVYMTLGLVRWVPLPPAP